MADKTRMRPDERTAFMGLNTLTQSLKTYYEPLAKRMAGDKYALPGLKAAQTHMQRAIDAIAGTVEQKNLDYINFNTRSFEVVIREKRITKDPHWMHVMTEDLELVLESVMANECAVCFKTMSEGKQCALRKALLNLCDEPPCEYGCGYRTGDFKRRQP